MEKISTLASFFIFSALCNSSAAVLSYNEVVDGDLGAPTAPTSLTFGIGANTIMGQVDTGGGDTRDAFSFTLGAGQILESVILLAYDNPTTTAVNDGNTGFYHFDDGLVSVIPNGTTSASLITGRTFNFGLAGTDLLNTTNQTGGPGIPAGELGAGSFTFNIQNTSTISDYTLQFNVIPEPTTASTLLLGSFLLLGKRSRK